MLRLVSPPNDVWETSTEISYWWRIMTQIWIVFLIGWIKFPMRDNQSETLPRSAYWCSHHQYGISALVSQTSLGGETSDSIAKCWLFSQAKHFPDIRKKNPSWWVREEKLKDSSMEQLLTTLKSTMPAFYLGFIVWDKSRVAEGQELPSGIRWHAPWEIF